MKTHWIEFFQVLCIATPKELVRSIGTDGLIVGDAIMVALPEDKDGGATTEAVEWLLEQENAS